MPKFEQKWCSWDQSNNSSPPHARACNLVSLMNKGNPRRSWQRAQCAQKFETIKSHAVGRMQGRKSKSEKSGFQWADLISAHFGQKNEPRWAGQSEQIWFQQILAKKTSQDARAIVSRFDFSRFWPKKRAKMHGPKCADLVSKDFFENLSHTCCHFCWNFSYFGVSYMFQSVLFVMTIQAFPYASPKLSNRQKRGNNFFWKISKCSFLPHSAYEAHGGHVEPFSIRVHSCGWFALQLCRDSLSLFSSVANVANNWPYLWPLGAQIWAKMMFMGSIK